MKTLIVSSLFTLGLILLSCNGKTAKSEQAKQDDGSSKLGLIVADLLDDETDHLTVMPSYSDKAPGTSTKYDRAFENAPPMIPHSTEGLLPITKDKHMCIGCHMPEVAVVLKSTPIPLSHLTNYRPDIKIKSDGSIISDNNTNQDLKGKLDMTRYNCTACHVPQANIEPAVKNNFEAAFRKNDAINKSNLAENITEGVK